MKLANLKLPFTIKELFKNFEQLSTEELQRISSKINLLITKRTSPNSENKEAKLLEKINKQLPKAFLERFELLKTKMQNETISKAELQEMEAYVEEIEEFDTNKITALHELSALRKVPFLELVEQLNPFPRPNE